MSSKLYAFFLITSLLIQSVGHAEEWIGLDSVPSWVAGFQLTEDTGEDNSKTVYLSKTLAGNTVLDLQYSTTSLTDSSDSFDSDTFSSQLGWTVTDEFNLGFKYQFQGKKNELENNQYALLLGYNPFPLSVSVEWLQGELFIYTRDRITAQSKLPDSIQSDLSSTTFSIGWWFENFQLSASLQQYSYEANISALQSRPLLQLLVKPAALAQSGLLLSEQSSVSLTIPFEERDLALHLLDSRSAVDDSKSHSIQLDWVETINSNTRLTLSINRSREDSDYWSLSAGLEWNG